MGVTGDFRDQFIKWVVSEGAELSPYITIDQSELGGAGVFFSWRKFREDHGLIDVDGCLEVMRIPKRLSFSLDRFKDELLIQQQIFDQDLGEFGQDPLNQSEIMTKFLETFLTHFNDTVDPYVKGGMNETNILVGQVQMLVILKRVRAKLVEKDAKNKVLQGSPFGELDEYLELLERTDVTAPRTDEFYPQYLSLFKYNVREYRRVIERLRFDSIYETLDSFGVEYQEFLDDEFLRHIELSVVSRLLEIPEALPEEEEKGRYDILNNRKVLNPTTVYTDNDPDATVIEQDDEDGDGKKYGFAVSSTLVPVIDFVNHSNDKMNAFFDVDASNGDILLRLFNEKFTSEDNIPESIELFIRYSDYEDVLKFVTAYGFIPRSVKVQPIFEHAIDREYLNEYFVRSEIDGQKYEHNLGLLLKWIGVQPNVQFVIQYNIDGSIKDVKMNLDENFIVFGFVEGLQYSREAALAIVKHYSEFQKDEYIAELLALEESDANDIIEGYDVIPYSCVYVENEDVNLETLVSNLPDDVINGLMLKFMGWFVEYSTTRISQLDSSLESIPDTSIVHQFAALEKNVLLKFKQEFEACKSEEDKLELVIGADDLDDEWLKHRLRPRNIPSGQRLELLIKHTNIESLNVSDSSE